MCEPTTIAYGAALLLGGAYVNNEGVKQADRASVSVRRLEDGRQKKYEDQAKQALDQNLQTATVEQVSGGQAAAAKSREDAYKTQQMAAPQASRQLSQGAMGGNKVVASSLGDALGSANKRADAIGAARAQLGGFGDSMFNTNLLLGRGTQKIDEAGRLAKASMSPIQAELGSAAHKGSKTRALGQLLQMAGSIYLAGAGGAAAGVGSGAAGAGAGAAAGAGAGSAAGGAALGSGAMSGLGSWLVPAASAVL